MNSVLCGRFLLPKICVFNANLERVILDAENAEKCQESGLKLCELCVSAVKIPYPELALVTSGRESQNQSATS